MSILQDTPGLHASLQVVADENIPFVREAFGTIGAVRTMAGRAIGPEDVREAEVLLVRSVTPVDRALLEGSRVQFVGSATIGTDHIDLPLLQARGIAFAHAPGSNAESVVEYVLAALLKLAAVRGEALGGRSVGVVGCGQIGGRLAARLPALGMRVLKHDPPLARAAERRGEAHDFVSLDRVLREADVVTLHVPLTRTGPFPTFHLIDDAALRRMRPEAWLLNTCRGAVVSSAALRRVLESGRLGAAVLDVWEGEPTPDPDLLRRVHLATPHIAGYSYDGKVAGTILLYGALAAHLECPPAWDYEAVLAPAPEDRLRLIPPAAGGTDEAWLHALVQQMYDIAADDRRLREILGQAPEARAGYFGELRRCYPRRRAFARHHVPASAVPEALRATVTQGLGVRLLREGTRADPSGGPAV